MIILYIPSNVFNLNIDLIHVYIFKRKFKWNKINYKKNTVKESLTFIIAK